MQTISEQKCFGGVQGIYSHQSPTTGTDMRFSVYVPPAGSVRSLPVLWYLSGLTCTEENFTVKAGAQRFAAEHGVILVAPDTSPRGAGLPGEDDAYDFGSGAGFYLDATVAPWSVHYKMYTYITAELPELVFQHFPSADDRRQGITGHSMGGHGALTIALKNPKVYRSVSAFSPICAPSQVPWGKKAFSGYLGDNRKAWKQYDATELVDAGYSTGPILIDQGDADDFLDEQLRPDLFRDTCRQAGQVLELRIQPGYDHSYYFIATFVGEHIAYHARALA
jgi:S-formylglutathione hydrolase